MRSRLSELATIAKVMEKVFVHVFQLQSNIWICCQAKFYEHMPPVLRAGAQVTARQCHRIVRLQDAGFDHHDRYECALENCAVYERNHTGFC
jgi:hypothetical protein